MRAIFISYRRDDSEGQAGRLYDDLIRQFGEGSVFMDVAAIEPGFDFRKVIDESVSSCGVLLALIGPAWLDAKDETGRRRLDDALDFVRLETAAALKRDIPVVPVLVAKARMPRAEQLPDDLKELAYRNGVELTHARWDTDVQVLVKALQRHMSNPLPGGAPPGGASSPPEGDRTQGHPVEKTKARAATEGASTLPPRPQPATKSWRTLAVAVAVVAAIAAGVGYAYYESRKASWGEEAKVRQAAAEAAARQLAEDQKATADKGAVRKATDQEAPQQAAADREAAKRAAPQPHSQASVPNFAGTWELIDATDKGEHHPAGIDAQRVTITQEGSLVKIWTHESAITREGTVTYQTFHALDGQNWHIAENEAEAALVDTFTWRLEGPVLVWETTFNYKAPYRNHPIGTDLRVIRYRRSVTGAIPAQGPSNGQGRAVHSSGRLTIRGTRSCDLDSGAETSAGADFWWEQETNVNRYLVPKNGAGFFVVGIRDFKSVKYADLERFQYSSQKIDASNQTYNQIPQRTVVAYKTNEGRFGKLIVDEYGYNLTIRWMTFE
jgi:hypothetical protein